MKEKILEILNLIADLAVKNIGEADRAKVKNTLAFQKSRLGAYMSDGWSKDVRDRIDSFVDTVEAGKANPEYLGRTIVEIERFLDRNLYLVENQSNRDNVNSKDHNSLHSPKNLKVKSDSTIFNDHI